MKDSGLIAIDFGSAFTKLSIRTDWDSTATLIRDPNAPKESNYCIPTVLAEVRLSVKSQVVIGAAAAVQIKSSSVKLVRNWKSKLFSPKWSAIGEDALSMSRDDAFRASVLYFKGLHAIVDAHRGTRGLPVRVCVPDLKGETSPEAIIREVLAASGWTPATDRATIFEPESNAIGILTRGRNATWVPRQQSYMPPPKLSVAMQKMFDTGMANAFRTMRESYGVLVTDIGAYTTDFGFVRFDSSFMTEDWRKPEMMQLSKALGIAELDKGVFDVLGDDAKDAIKKMSPADWEQRKRILYAGKPVMLRKASGGNVLVGDGKEGLAIILKIESFARKVVAARDAFCSQFGIKKVNEEILSGGGSMISLLRRALVEKSVGEILQDLMDPDEPDQATRRGNGKMTEPAKDKRRSQNQVLVRGGSTLGAASVYF